MTDELSTSFTLQTQQVVAFSLADEDYAVPIKNVKEIILIDGITQVPQMPHFILGVINLRGQVIPVIDLRKRLNLTVAEINEQSRIMVSRIDGRIVGLVVDAVSQVMKIDPKQIQDPPETIASVTSDYITGIAKISEQMIICLDLQRILDQSQFVTR